MGAKVKLADERKPCSNCLTTVALYAYLSVLASLTVDRDFTYFGENFIDCFDNTFKSLKLPPCISKNSQRNHCCCSDKLQSRTIFTHHRDHMTQPAQTSFINLLNYLKVVIRYFTQLIVLVGIGPSILHQTFFSKSPIADSLEVIVQVSAH